MSGIPQNGKKVHRKPRPKILFGTTSVMKYNQQRTYDRQNGDNELVPSFDMSLVRDQLPNDHEDDTYKQHRRKSPPNGVTMFAKIFNVQEQLLNTKAYIYIYESDRYFYQHIETYIQNSQCHNFRMKLRQVFEIKRKGEPNFKGKRKRMMLWHGTKKSTIPTIIQNGFARPIPKNQMYGNGIYFADRCSKSAQYCDGTTKGNFGYLFICDVMLGNKMYKAKNPHNEFTQPPPGFTSVKGTGKRVPTWEDSEYYYGSQMPIGKTKDDTRFPSYNLVHNEYIVYDEKTINIIFLVEVEFV